MAKLACGWDFPTQSEVEVQCFFEHWIYLAGLCFLLREILKKSLKKHVKTKQHVVQKMQKL